VRANHAVRKNPITNHVKANVKQVIEGKAASNMSKVLKAQSDAVVAMGTKAKMAMCQGPVIQSFRSGQTNEISPTTAPLLHSFIPAMFLRTTRMLLSLRRWFRQSIWHPLAMAGYRITPVLVFWT
jgi:hypothetical protein